MNSESVDLIYLDPPFNSNTNYAAPIGSVAAGAAFSDTWTLSDLDAEWIELMESQHPALWRVLLAAMSDSDKAYLAYMAIRLLEMHRILRPTGSIYLHCDPTMSHYLKLLLDAIFGREQFRNEITWHYGLGGYNTKRWFPRKHDVIFYYAKSRLAHHNKIRGEVSKWMKAKYHLEDAGGHYFVQNDKKYYLKGGKPVDTVWDNDELIEYTMSQTSPERIGYPTQKPLAVLHRVIEASSNPGEIVFDPFAGCATTCVAAHDLNRSWIGIDISPMAAQLVVDRLRGRQGIFEDVIHRTDILQRTDLGRLPPHNGVENRKRLYGEQGGHCAGCGLHFREQNLTVDHIIARSKGGTDHISNLQLLCARCNSVKGDRGMAYLRDRLQMAT
ncbi:DNA methyltransferase [Candidatus Poriferisodalis sp.]|uniref:DNA methyltransferase n=1 Tax=Candidatus Poriferisodalis sp. TaxID=3101277 RepID=UPI003B02C8B4